MGLGNNLAIAGGEGFGEPAPKLLNEDRARSVMAELGLDALIATTYKNVWYLGSFMPDSVLGSFADVTAAAILPATTDAPPALIASDYDLAYLTTKPTWMPELHMYSAKTRSSAAFLLETLNRGLGLETDLRRPLKQLYTATRPHAEDDLIGSLVAYIGRELGAGKLRLAVDDLRVGAELRAKLGERVEIVDALNIFRRIRMVKTEAEIDIMRKAARINDAAVLDAAAAAEVGGTIYSYVEAYRLGMVRRGARFIGERGMLFAAGPDGGFVLDNDYAERQHLADGDMAIFDCIGTYRLYHCDMARTGVVGNPKGETEGIFAIVREALKTAEDAIRPGIHTTELRKIASDIIGGKGLDLNLTTLVWHGIGLDVLEFMDPADKVNGWTVEEGMCMNFEVFHRNPDLGGFHLEDTVVVRKNGAEYLSGLPRDLVHAGGVRQAAE